MGRCFRSFYYQALNSTVERYPAFWTTHLQKQTGDSQAQESRCHAAGLQLTLHSQLGSSVAPKYCRKKLHSIVTFCLSALPRCTNFNLCNLNYTKLNNIAYKMQIYCTCATTIMICTASPYPENLSFTAYSVHKLRKLFW